MIQPIYKNKSLPFGGGLSLYHVPIASGFVLQPQSRLSFRSSKIIKATDFHLPLVFLFLLNIPQVSTYAECRTQQPYQHRSREV